MTAAPVTSPATELPWIVSVDDHVTEPPDLWTARLPRDLVAQGPRVERHRVKVPADGRSMAMELDTPDGRWADLWSYEGRPLPWGRLTAITHAVGFDEITSAPLTFDEICPGSWKQAERLADMDRNHVEASLSFPNVVPRFCGQTFLEGDDKTLGLRCVQAYNDWMIDDWCAGQGRGRLIPLTLVPLWDPELAAAEVRRCAAKGSHAVSFCENPYELGLPSFHDPRRPWDAFLAACEETDTVVNMHIGSSSKLPTSSPDAPYMMTSILMYQNSASSVLDVILSGVFERFPGLKVAYSEGQIGWLPYAVRRADRVWAGPDKEGGGYARTPHPPSSYVAGHVFGCIFDDDTALHSRDLIGIDQIMFEVDYPHSAMSFPHSAELARELFSDAGLDAEEQDKVLRGNAIRVFGLERIGVTT